MKRWIAVLLCVITVLTLGGCSEKIGSLFESENQSGTTTKKTTQDSGFKVGFLFSGEEESNLAVKARIESVRKMQGQVSLKDRQLVLKEGVTKNNCAKTIRSMIEDGCQLIISTDPLFEESVLEAAKKNTEVEFCQEGGEEAKSSKLANLHDYYSRIYEAYYVAGVAAGMKLNHMLDEGDISTESCYVGFVASEESAASISCCNAFYLGIRKMCSQAQMLVRYAEATGDADDDREAAEQLIAAGVVLMGCCTQTDAVPADCAEHSIPVVGAETGIIATAPEVGITSATTDWSVYYTYAVNAITQGESIDTDWCEGYKEGTVCISQLNDKKLVEETVDELATVEKSLRNGKTKVFDTSTFTIDGKSMEQAVEDTKYSAYAGYVSEGEFHESERNSAPAFDILIDGIEVTTEDYVAAQEALEEEEADTEIEE